MMNKKMNLRIRTVLAGLLVLLLSVLGGCGSLRADENTIQFRSNGQIRAVYVSAFPRSEYNSVLLEQEVKDTVSAYNKAAGEKRISAGAVSTTEDTARISIRYRSYEDYNAFNGQDIFYGTAQDGVTEGILESNIRVKSPDGAENTTIGKLADAERDGESRFRIIAVDENAVILHRGTPAYISNNVEIEENGEVRAVPVPEDGLSGEKAYIIYKI